MRLQWWQVAFPVVFLVLVGALIALNWQTPELHPVDLGHGEPEMTRAELEALVAQEPENVQAFFDLGLVCLQEDDADCARTALLRALELDPQRAAAVHHNLGVLAFKVGDMETALSEFQAALEVDPDDLNTRYQLGAVYLVLSIPANSPFADVDKLELAIAQFEQVLAVNPDKVEALVGLGNARLIEGNYEEGVALLERAVALAPIPEALFSLGRAYAFLGRTEEARVTLERFLDTNPPLPWANQAQAILQQLGQ